MKDILIVIACGLAFVGFCYAFSCGIERQFIVDCYRNKDICEKYHDQHKGQCRECEIMKLCEAERVY